MDNTKKTPLKRVTLEINDRRLHSEMKILAVKCGKDLKAMTTEAVKEYLQRHSGTELTQNKVKTD